MKRLTKEDFKKVLKDCLWAYFYLLLLAIIIMIIIFIVQMHMHKIKSEKTKEEEKKVYIEMDAVTAYSCKEYSVFSTAEFSSFVVFGEPLREYYEPVILVIDTKNTSNTADDEVIKVKKRNCTDINSTGGEIYG